MNELFPTSFLGAIAALSISMRTARPRAMHGIYQAPAAGSSLDFRDFHAYTAGDDLRRVDWNVYRRTHHLFLRRFEQATSTTINVLVDTSASMFVESPPRYTAAARIAAAVISAGILSQNNVNLGMMCDERSSPPLKIRGRTSFITALRELSSRQVASRRGPSSVHGILSLWGVLREIGVTVIVSDFLDPQGADSIVRDLSKVPHRLILLSLRQPWDDQPALQLNSLETTLVDCESDERRAVSPQFHEFNSYIEAYQNHFTTLQRFARNRGATMVSFDASMEIVPQLQKLFPSGVLSI